MGGIDPEVAADIGIPTDPEMLQTQVESARKVAGLLDQHSALPAVDAQTEARQEWVGSMPLTHPTSAFPEGIPRLSTTDRATRSQHFATLHDNIKPFSGTG